MLGQFGKSTVVYLQPKIIYQQDASNLFRCEISKFKTSSTTLFRIDSLGMIDQSLGKILARYESTAYPFMGTPTPDMLDRKWTHTQVVTSSSSYAGARNNIQIGANDNTKKGLTNRSNTRTPSRNIELHHLDKWTTPRIEVQEL
jgi:hypothetical protein